MSLDFIATGDIHAHIWKQFSITLPNGRNSRLENCLRVFQLMREHGRRLKITKLLYNGDIYQDNAFLSVEVFDAVYREIEKGYEEGFDQVINIGNHDTLGKLAGRNIHSLRPFNKVATVIERPTLVWNALQVIPYSEDHESIKQHVRIAGEISRRGKRTAIALHCGVQGAKTGPNDYLARNPIKCEDLRGADFSVVLLSDFHTPQRLAKNVFYLGSPLQHSFGESHKAAIWHVSLDRSYEAQFRIVPLYTCLPSFRRLKVRKLKDIKNKLKEFEGDYVKLLLTPNCTLEDNVIRKAVGGRFLYSIGHLEEDRDKTALNEQSLGIDEVVIIENYAEHKQRLVELGKKIYV